MHDKFGYGCAGCKTLMAIVGLLLTLTTIAAFIGVWNTHVTAAGWVFGTADGSLALLTLIISAMAWLKVVKKLCPCGKGMCLACGNSPCTCK